MPTPIQLPIQKTDNETKSTVSVSKGAIIIGASSGIAKAVISKLITGHEYNVIICISQSDISNFITTLQINSNVNNTVKCLICDYSDAAMAKSIQELKEINVNWQRIIICNGILHNVITAKGSVAQCPEKSLEEVERDAMLANFDVNSVTPTLWLKHLIQLLKGDWPCMLAILSARVGSISDNRLGGWYSYRASKAALNMCIKTAAIEYARKARNVKLVAFHPGTTDTQLSKPFQSNVPKDKLFTTSYVAERLLDLLSQLSPDGEASYLDWNHQSIHW
ncbi:SDR family NAD(P)-dependent oxidoreductase [Flocculibacter collagenilyticus]|uniref:SDR family NAD(P)-dependent oxidoreductase n=1 Tax=Flocculibacter collagenilyticus TaxID=2744479 RepID=UPI0018F3E456|nr:SDR family NAD(P)-dependent oxidoreductase [Flocculibacter collagenilyticus]